MTEQYLSEEQITSFYRRFLLIKNELDQERTIEKVLSKVKLSPDAIIEFKTLPGFTNRVFSTHPNITFYLVKSFPELFSIDDFLSSSTNSALILDADFRKKYSLKDDDVIKFIERQKKVSDKVFQNVDVENESLELISTLIEKTEVNGNVFVKENIEKCKKKFGNDLLTLKVINSGKLEFSSDELIKAFKKEEVTLKNILITLKFLKDYPADLLSFVEYLEEEEFERDKNPETTSTEFFNEVVFTEELLSRILAILFRTCDKPVPENFLYNFAIRASEDNLMRITEMLVKYFGEQSIIILAREKNYERLILQLAFLSE